MHEEFREAITKAVSKHGIHISPEDLREAARLLEKEAENREDSPL